MDPGTLVASRLIAHQVPRSKGKEDTREPRLSTTVPELPAVTLEFFVQRIKRSLSDSGQEVEVDSRLESPRVPTLVREHLLATQRDLVATSQSAAKLLFEAQGGSRYEDESLFVTVDATVDGQAALGMLKLEKESGVEFEEQATKDGGSTLVVSVNERLLLTDNTRVFKAALFIVKDGAVVGLVSDDQQGAPTEVARYFLSGFLGCAHRRRPATVTSSFYSTVERFISTEVPDAGDKLDYQAALHVEIQANRKKIDPKIFIADNFKVEHRAPLERRLVEAGVPTASFEKDTSRLGSRVERSRLKTASGIVISGSAAAVAERVRSDEDSDGTPVLVIRDTLT